MSVDATPDNIDTEPLFYSRPSSPIDVRPVPPRDLHKVNRLPPNVDQPAVQSKVESCDVNDYSYLLDLEDLIADDPHPNEASRDAALDNKNRSAEFDPSSPFQPKMIEKVRSSQPRLDSDDWWETPIVSSHHAAPPDRPTAPVRNGSAAEAILTVPVHKADDPSPIPIKIQDPLYACEGADWDDWFTDGNIEIID